MSAAFDDWMKWGGPSADEVWAAAGHPHGVFRLRPQDLGAWTGAPVADVVAR